MMTPTHPHQPILVDAHGVRRFLANACVRDLLDAASAGRKMDLNDLARGAYPDADQVQFAQFIGYSVCGFGDLSYVSDAAYAAATAAPPLSPEAVIAECDGVAAACDAERAEARERNAGGAEARCAGAARALRDLAAWIRAQGGQAPAPDAEAQRGDAPAPTLDDRIGRLEAIVVNALLVDRNGTPYDERSGAQDLVVCLCRDIEREGQAAEGRPVMAAHEVVTRLFKYTVPPFSRQPKRPRCDDRTEQPCAICCRGVVVTPETPIAVVVDGGAAWGDENSPEDAGYMGSFPVGSDCHRRFVARS